MYLPKPTDAPLPHSCPVTSSTMPPCPASFARLLRIGIATQPHSPQDLWRSPRPNKDSSDCSTSLFVVQRSNKIVSLPVLSDASGRRRPSPPHPHVRGAVRWRLISARVDDPPFPPRRYIRSLARSLDYLPRTDDRRDRCYGPTFTHPHEDDDDHHTPPSSCDVTSSALPFPRLPLVAPHTGGTHQFPARCASIVSFHVIVRRPRVWARAATRRCRVIAARDAASRGECGRPQRKAAWRPPLRRARSVRSTAACAQP